MRSTPQAIVFDIGNVLIGVDLDLCPVKWSRAAALDPQRTREIFWADRDYQPLERGEISLEDYRRSMNRRLEADISPEDFYNGWTGVYLGEVPGMTELMAALAGKLRMACLSNTNAAHVETFTAQFPHLFEPLERNFFSNEMRLRKPDPAIYRPVIEHFDLAAERIVFVDDKPANVEAACALGMRGVIFTDAEALKLELTAMGIAV